MITTRAPATVTCSFLVALGATGCEKPAPKPPAVLVTMASLASLPESASFGAGLDDQFSGGFERSYFLSQGRIRVATAYTERAVSAYMTTDLWVNFPKVWIQPLYILKSPSGTPKPQWVFSVAEGSRFYSPFWEVWNVTVPDGTPPDKYTSVRAILDAKLPMTRGRGQLAALVPGGVEPEHLDEDKLDHFAATFVETRAALAPATTTLKSAYSLHTNGWVDGQPRSFVDFGVDRFEWNEDGEVVEAPLFFFFTSDGHGGWAPVTDLPRVGGTGPLYARRPAVAPKNRPVFGSFWRLWAARLPSTAAVLVPDDLREAWRIHTTDPGHTSLTPVYGPANPDPALDAAIKRHAFSVMADAGCLSGPLDAGAAPQMTAEALNACTWLDSQQALEDHLTRDNLVPSQILVSCPYLAINDKVVPLTP